MTRRRSPRRLGAALAPASRRARPRTLLAAVQEAWPAVAGPTVAGEATAVSERGGVVTVACRSGTWAAELDLLQSELLARLKTALAETGSDEAGWELSALRFTADAARHES